MNPRLRVDQVGSLLRPQELKAVYARHGIGRINEASRFLALERLALSSQCGFSSNIVGNLISEDDQWRKLELVHKVAADVWAI